MLKPLSVALFALAITSSAGFSQTQVTRSVSIDDSFQQANARWNNATAGGYDALIALKANKGVFEFCGVGAVSNAQLATTIKGMLRGCRLTINGKVVLKNCSYFAKARSTSAVPKTKANCASTGMKVQQIKDIDFRYGNMTFRN